MNNELLKDFKTKFEAMNINEQQQVLGYADTVNNMHRYIKKLDLEECEVLLTILISQIKYTKERAEYLVSELN